MRAGRRDLERSTRAGLAAHVGEVVQTTAARASHLAGRPGQLAALAERLAQLGQRADRADLEPLDQPCLGRVGPGDDGALQAPARARRAAGEHAAQRLHGTLEGQLADEQHALERLARDYAERAERGGGDARSKPLPVFFTSAGARLTTIWHSEICTAMCARALLTRTRLSRTAASARPTSSK